mmetsp:Transcript_13829/g.28567  ORF Transcript_13829/g.28567 Transcript_13829/m.28567 type:complete len:289 (+) Transcript_13829:268-1134(+)
MNATSTCSLLIQLEIDRIFFFGDSISGLQYKSFLNKLGKDHVRTTDKFTSTLACPLFNTHKNEKESKEIKLRYAKEGGGNDFPGSARKTMVLSNQSENFLAPSSKGGSERGRLLAILNIGAHYHELSHFKEDFVKLVGWVEASMRPHDLVFYRTSVPGHKNCIPRNPRQFNFTAGIRVVPLQSYRDFQVSTQYEWNLFDGYNDFAKGYLAKRNIKTARERSLSTIHLLDVVNLTVLRRDGHTGGKDCLHYVTPGPTDWWNHLLYTKLRLLSLCFDKIERVEIFSKTTF